MNNHIVLVISIWIGAIILIAWWIAGLMLDKPKHRKGKTKIYGRGVKEQLEEDSELVATLHYAPPPASGLTKEEYDALSPEEREIIDTYYKSDSVKELKNQ